VACPLAGSGKIVVVLRPKLFVWQAFWQEKKIQFARGVKIYVTKKSLKSNIIVPESHSGLQFFTLCQYVSYAYYDQISLP
jgi:hypothetical protein